MKHIKTFENYEMTNEELFGIGENKEAKARVEKQFDDLNAKLVGTKGDQTKNKESWLKRAKDQDGFNGDFTIDRGVLQYKSKSKNPLQGKTGGSSGMGTANENKFTDLFKSKSTKNIENINKANTQRAIDQENSSYDDEWLLDKFMKRVEKDVVSNPDISKFQKGSNMISYLLNNTKITLYHFAGVNTFTIDDSSFEAKPSKIEKYFNDLNSYYAECQDLITKDKRSTIRDRFKKIE